MIIESIIAIAVLAMVIIAFKKYILDTPAKVQQPTQPISTVDPVVAILSNPTVINNPELLDAMLSAIPKEEQTPTLNTAAILKVLKNDKFKNNPDITTAILTALSKNK